MKRERARRVIAFILVILLAGGAVVGALISALSASAEEAEATLPLNRQELKIEYLEDQQALHISQRLVYTNASEDALEEVVFFAAGNMFRRQDGLFYEQDELAAVFPQGYVPAGVDLRSARFEGQDADYGFQGTDELYLRVACDIQPGESGTFEFDFYLLLACCNAFQGVGNTDVRASAFYFVPCMYDATYAEFILKKPLSTRTAAFYRAKNRGTAFVVPRLFIIGSELDFDRLARIELVGVLQVVPLHELLGRDVVHGRDLVQRVARLDLVAKNGAAADSIEIVVVHCYFIHCHCFFLQFLDSGVSLPARIQ